MKGETVFSVLTPTGRGAVAVVAVNGPQAVAAVDPFFRARNRLSLAEQAIGRIVYGYWGGEDLVVCRRDEHNIEIHCHGGSQSVTAIAHDLQSAGCVAISWRDWAKRREDCPIRAAARIALAESASTRTAAILLDQFHGALRRELETIISLVGIALVGYQNSEVRHRLEALLKTAALGQHLTKAWQVVIAGRPNVGKSSLINALVGYERAIVFDQPGTTRDVVTASTVIDGWPVALSDTAGLHAASNELEMAGVGLARKRLSTADLVVWVLDATQVSDDSLQADVDRQAMELELELPDELLLVINKIDQPATVRIPEYVLSTCAISRAGVDRLLSAISGALVPDVRPAGSAVLFTAEQAQAVAAALAAFNQENWSEAAGVLRGLLGTACGESKG